MMDEGRIIGQGTYDEMEKIKEFSDLMEINSLNKEVPKKKGDDDKGSAEGDTITEDSNEDEEDDSPAPKALGELDLDEPGMDLEEKEMAKKMSKKATKTKKKAEAAELSSDVEGSDGGDDDDEEVLPEVVFPSTLTKAEKLLRIQKFMTVKPKKKEEVDDKNNLGNDSDSGEEDNGEESNKVNQSVQRETIDLILKYQNSTITYVLTMISHIFEQYVTFQASFMLGEWAESKVLKTDKTAFWGHVFKIFFFNLITIINRQIR